MPPGLSCPGLKLTFQIQTNLKVGQAIPHACPAKRNNTKQNGGMLVWPKQPKSAPRPHKSHQRVASPACPLFATITQTPVRPSESNLKVPTSQFRLRFQSQLPATLRFTLISLTHQRVSQIQERLSELRSLIDRFLIKPGSVLKMSLPMQQ